MPYGLVDYVLPVGGRLMPLHIIDAFTARYTGKDPGNAGTAPQPDRRQQPRRPVRWPLTLWREGWEAVETVTDNLSSSGFYCLSPMPLMPGELIRCALRTPSYAPDCRHIGLECKVLVVRAEAAADGFYGIACHIEEYHLASGSS